MAALPIAGRVFAVTGGAGFIGGRLVERLSEAGAARVVVLDRGGGASAKAALAARVDGHRVDLGEASAADLAVLLTGVDGLFHLAAEKHSEAQGRPEGILTTNVLGTHALFEAARMAGVKKTVFASSLYAYGRVRGEPLVETETPHPTTVYGISKLAGEQLGAHFAERGGPAFVALRYFFAYGPGQAALHGRPSLIVRTLERLARGESPTVRGDGSQALDYVYVDDVADATIAAMARPVTEVTVNVGSGAALPVRELIERIQAIAGTRLDVVEEPADETAGTRRVASTARMHDALLFTPRVHLDEGLRRTWDALRARD